MSRRGVPSTMYSDNAKTFIIADRYFKAIRTSKLLDFLANNGITWHFSASLAPWWGGWWERLIGLVKSLLRKSLSTESLTYLELETILIEVEYVVNHRPLTYASAEPGDDIPLCPQHLMTDRRLSGGVPLFNTSPQLHLNLDALIAMDRRVRHLLDHWWTRWNNEYLTELKRFHCGGKKTRTLQPSKILTGNVQLGKWVGLWKSFAVEMAMSEALVCAPLLVSSIEQFNLFFL